MYFIFYFKSNEQKEMKNQIQRIHFCDVYDDKSTKYTIRRRDRIGS